MTYGAMQFNFVWMRKRGRVPLFCLEKFENEKLIYKINAERIHWNEKDSSYTLFNYVKRTIGPLNDNLVKIDKKTGRATGSVGKKRRRV